MDEILWEQAIDIMEHGDNLVGLRIICPAGWVWTDILGVKTPHKVLVMNSEFVADCGCETG
jgi:hypothetical protein